MKIRIRNWLSLAPSDVPIRNGYLTKSTAEGSNA
jgi:hypothetical protein